MTKKVGTQLKEEEMCPLGFSGNVGISIRTWAMRMVCSDCGKVKH